MSDWSNYSAPQEELSNVRALRPRLLLTEESQCKEVSGEVSNRFGLPAVRLVNLPSSFVKSFCSQMLGTPDDALEDYVDEEAITYTAVSSIKYVTTDGYRIYLTTLLLSRKAEKLEYRALESTFTSDGSEGTSKVTLKDGIQAMLFTNSAREEIRNQVVFVKSYAGYKYYVTVGSDLPATSLVNLLLKHLEFV